MWVFIGLFEVKWLFPYQKRKNDEVNQGRWNLHLFSVVRNSLPRGYFLVRRNSVYVRCEYLFEACLHPFFSYYFYHNTRISYLYFLCIRDCMSSQEVVDFVGKQLKHVSVIIYPVCS